MTIPTPHERVKQALQKATTLHGEVITVAGSNVACVVNDLETVTDLTEAGVKKTRSMETDIIASNMGTHAFNVGTLGTYAGDVLRVASPKTKHSGGLVYRINWNAE